MTTTDTRWPRGPDGTAVRSPYILDRSKHYGPDHTRSARTVDGMRAAALVVLVAALVGCAAEPPSSPSSEEAPASSAAPDASLTAPDPVAVPAVEQAPARPLATAGRPRSARLSIPALDLRDVRVVPYAGTPDDRPGTAIQDAGDLAAPHGGGGLVGPGGLGNFLVTGHRTSSTRPFAALPTLRPGARVVVETRTHRLVYEITRTRWTSFRRPSSLASPVRRSPWPPRPRSHPRDDHAVDVRHR